MGGVLIDDDDPGFGLRDDVVFMHLRAGGPQGTGLVAHRGRLDPCRRRSLRLGKAKTRRRRVWRGGLIGHGSAQGPRRGAIHLIDTRPHRFGPHRAKRRPGHGA